MKSLSRRRKSNQHNKSDLNKMKLNKKSNKLVMNVLKNHHDDLNMQMKNSKFVSSMYNLCKNAYNDSRDVDYSISYHAVNTDEFGHLQPSLFMDKIFIDEIQKKLNFCYKSSVTIKNKTFYITFYTNLNQKINFTSYMNKIILLLCLSLSYVKDENPLTYNITYVCNGS